jgi:ABC-type branched-subunit amino acid transport system permease subunit
VGWIPFLGLLGWLGTSGDPTLIHVGALIAIWTMWGMSLNMVWGYAGQFSMAQVGLGAVSAYVAAILFTEKGWSLWPAILVALLAAMLASLIVGLASLKLSGFYFSIMTLAFTLLLLSYVRTLDVAGRSTGISTRFEFGTVDLGFASWNLSSRQGGFLLFSTLLVGAFLLLMGRLERSRSGRALVAMREDPILATSVGVHEARHRLFAFVVSSLLSGTAGICYASYLRFISPSFFSFSALIVVIVQVVIGGVGYRFGPFFGAFVYIGLTEWLRVGGDYREGIFGLTLVLIVLFAPKGVLGTGDTLFRRLREGELRTTLTGSKRQVR